LSIGHAPAKAIEGKSKIIKVIESIFFISSFLSLYKKCKFRIKKFILNEV
jgi:hypothetical protein